MLDEKQSKRPKAVIMFLLDHSIKYIRSSLIFRKYSKVLRNKIVPRKVLSAVEGMALSKYFIFLASGAWGTKKEFLTNLNEAAEGTITFSPKSYNVPSNFVLYVCCHLVE
jgi:hypothetical protein